MQSRQQNENENHNERPEIETTHKKSSYPRTAANNPAWVWVFLIGTIVLAGFGFVYKLTEFIISWVTSDGADFAITPIATYLAVALGYMFLFIWAWKRGMFRDIEGPKYRMLEMQDEFDALEEGTKK